MTLFLKFDNCNDKSLMLLEPLCQTGKQEQLYDNPKYRGRGKQIYILSHMPLQDKCKAIVYTN